MLISRFCCISTLFLLMLPAAVQAQFTFTTNNGAITITHYAGPHLPAIIPSTTNGYPVVSIGNSAFEECFATDVIIPESVTNIGTDAFLRCEDLTNVAIPGSVMNIGTNAFGYCSSLADLTISNGVAGIGNSAFFQCTNLTNVTIPGSVETVGITAFGLCSRLEGVTISNGVASIGNDAFIFCTNLNSVTIPASVTNIGSATFYWCPLTNFVVDAANPAYSSLNGVLFDKAQTTVVAYAIGLTNSAYTIPASVTSVGVQAFSGCVSLASVTIPASVTSIGELAFYDCTNLTGITFPNSVTNIGEDAFYACENLRFAYFPGNAPHDDGTVFPGDPSCTVYYLPGTSGWSATFGGAPAALWNPQATAFTTTGGQFGFSITGPTNAPIVVEACTNLANPVWLPVSTNTLSSSGASSFSDPQWTNCPNSYYRFSAP